MSRLISGYPPVILSFPRVSGDEPTGKPLDDVHNWFSPRERG